MGRTFALLLALTPFLAACAETRTACLARADRDLRAIDAEIEETERALALGYRPAPRGGARVGLAVCSRDSPLTVCLSGDRPVSARDAPIDPRAERARLEDLRARRPAVEAIARRERAQCEAG